MASEQELEVAGWITELVQRQYGVNVGPATERDGKDDSGLTNDFTFDEAVPPLALEVTRLRDDFDSPPLDALHRMEKRLERFLADKACGHWTVGIRAETHLRSDLEPAARRIVEWMLAAELMRLGPGTYVHDVSPDLIVRLGDPFMRDCEQARMAGVIMITRNDAGGLRIVPVAEFSDSKSLQRPVARAFANKTKSLGRARERGYVTMLAADVEREDARVYLAGSVRAPGFPPQIDHLWLLVRGANKVFYAKRDDRRLQELDLPR